MKAGGGNTIGACRLSGFPPPLSVRLGFGARVALVFFAIDPLWDGFSSPFLVPPSLEPYTCTSSLRFIVDVELG